MISGAVYLEGDVIQIQTEVTDVAQGRPFGSPERVVGPRQTPSQVVGQLQQRVLAFLALALDERLAASA